MVALVSSSVLEYENSRNPYPIKKEAMNHYLQMAGSRQVVDSRELLVLSSSLSAAADLSRYATLSFSGGEVGRISSECSASCKNETEFPPKECEILASYEPADVVVSSSFTSERR